MTMTPTLTAPPHLPPPLHVRQRIHLQSQQALAMANGVDALAQRAVENGEASYDQLQHIALLSAMMADHVRQLSSHCAELSSPAAND
ncbi:hypothetical protein [Salinicola sp. CPA57]|uniref:hypothetical protein n=1 Tax=Salinicola sp. CPA57 TaxID=1949080 RepID=UPI000DA2154F|nr:hypothetical protein [Salinicola sp. CPA57]